MIDVSADVAVLGAGFGGSLTALLLERIGLRLVLIDRGSHPRFAIGESSTPTADLVLRDLSRRYHLPQFEPLAKYGSWQATYPEVVCGIKRGFSYFHHEPHRPFVPRGDHSNELLVAASSDDETADTHWLRSDVDSFFADGVEAAGIPYFDRTEIVPIRETGGWRLEGVRGDVSVRIGARFLIDATGEAGVVPRALGVAIRSNRFKTNSRALFAHFADLKPWHDFLVSQQAAVEDHPFLCDHAALHHLLAEGWMWQLQFNNGVTSAGFAIDNEAFPLDRSVSVQEEWGYWMGRYPALSRCFQEARIVQPPGTLLRTGRLQRCAERMVGDGWALLPHTAGFIDPLHSSGIAQTMCGIERLISLLAEHWEKPTLIKELAGYESSLRAEFSLIDDLVAGCYRTRRQFRLFAAFCMLYFAAATTYERRRLEGELASGTAFLCADDPEFVGVIAELGRRVEALMVEGAASESSIAKFEQEVAAAIEPYNHAGLCDPSARNMYRHTAVSKE